ncbi:hypothetical protein P154DRAFT_263339 [Amniculicola lignicola CBS 123094]|uniref:Uncharacterized protein n=1 Tax=Amniculicola lignicola CBS 123094 TaxID=1392246 RepID=A0A6A5W9R1_9PLEO|nr:hypothetical protein P154DRAFT_263339 [Amniculicola lignicola CBS 123094]
MRLITIAALLCSLATARLIPFHDLAPHVSRPRIHRVQTLKNLDSRENTLLVPTETTQPTNEPIVEYPPAAKESKVVYKDGQKQCEHFSPTAGHTWGPCDTKNDSPKHDFRENLPEQWCGPDTLCQKPTWVVNHKVNAKAKRPPWEIAEG